MNKEEEQENNNQEIVICLKCNEAPENYINLHCQHNFCLSCLAEKFFENKKNDDNADYIICELCNKRTKLDSSSINALETVIKAKKSVFEVIFEESAENFNTDEFKKFKNSTERLKNSGEKSKESDKIQKNYEFLDSNNKTINYNSDMKNDKRKTGKNPLCEIHKWQTGEYVCFNCNISYLCITCIDENHFTHNVNKISNIINSCFELINYSNQRFNEIINFELKLSNIEKNELERIKNEENEIKGIFDNLHKFLFEKESEICGKINKNFEDFLKETNETKKEFIEGKNRLNSISENIQLILNKKFIEENRNLNEIIKCYNLKRKIDEIVEPENKNYQKSDFKHEIKNLMDNFEKISTEKIKFIKEITSSNENHDFLKNSKIKNKGDKILDEFFDHKNIEFYDNSYKNSRKTENLTLENSRKTFLEEKSFSKQENFDNLINNDSFKKNQFNPEKIVNVNLQKQKIAFERQKNFSQWKYK